MYKFGVQAKCYSRVSVTNKAIQEVAGLKLVIIN